MSKNYTKHTHHTGAQTTHTGGTPIDKRSNTSNSNSNSNADADADADANTRLMIQTLSTLSNRTETPSPIQIHIEPLIQCMIRSEGTRLQYQLIKKDWIINRLMHMQLKLLKRERSRQCSRSRQRSRQLADISISRSTSCGNEDEGNLHLRKEGEEVQGLSTGQNINTIPASNTSSATSTVVSSVPVVSIPQPSLPLKRISYCSIRHDRRKKYTRRKVGSK